MADQIRKMKCLTATGEDKPGVLAQILKGLADAGANLVGLWAYPTSPGRAEIQCVPDDPEKVRSVAASAGIALTEKDVFVVQGEDRVGALVDATRKIADAGVNLHSTVALAAGGQYAAVITVKAEDVDKVAAVLGV
jgi:hypothetical protein